MNTAAMSYQTQNPRFIKAFVQAGVLAQGLLQCLAVVAPQPRLGFVRILSANHSSRHPALRIRRGKRATPDIPEFLMATAESDPLTKFIAERQDTENMRTFRLAS